MSFRMKFSDMKSYDKRLTLWITIAGVFNSFAVLAPIVNHYQPDFHCDLNQLFKSDKTFNATISSEQNQQADSFKRFMIPIENTEKSKTKLSSCYVYNRTWTDFIAFRNLQSNNLSDVNFSHEKIACSAYTFDFTHGEYSATAQYSMVCDNAYKKSLAVFTYMLGMTIGGIISGYASDKLGRKPIFLVSQLGQFFFFGLNGFSPNYLVYITFVCIYGAAGMVNFYTSVLLGAETTIRKNRNIICVCAHLGYASGYMIFALTAYLVRDWRWLCWIGGLLGICYVPLIWIVDESPRWLLTAGKKRRAQKVIEKIAKYNGESCKETTEKLLENELDDDAAKKLSFAAIFRMSFSQPFILTRLMVVGLAWCMVNVSYYGIALTTNDLSGDRFINCLLSAISELFSYSFTFVLIEYVGRRDTYIGCMSIAGVCIALLPWINAYNELLTTAVTIFSKFLVTNSFYVVYVLTSEVFPTAIRHTASAIDSGFSRCGGIIMSFVIYGDNTLTAPIIGIFTAVSAILFVLVPKTHNQPLPSTIEDARKMKRGIPKVFLRCQGLVEDEKKLENIQYRSATAI